MRKIDQDRMLDRFKRQVDELTSEERAFLCRLNDKLSELEQQIKSETLKLIDEAEKRLKESDLWNIGYDIECVLDVYISEDDPAWDEEDDNILAVIDEFYDKEYFGRTFGICDGENHNEFQYNEHPLKNEFHCWFYHCLYHHTDLDWGNLLRIDSISVDLRLLFQCEVEV